MVPWVDLQFVNVLFPDHTHLLFTQTQRDGQASARFIDGRRSTIDSNLVSAQNANPIKWVPT